MRLLLISLLLVLAACKEDPGGGELTGTSSPEAEGRRLNEAPPPGSDTALSGTFGGQAPNAPGESATTGSHPGATGTDTANPMDPHVTNTGAQPVGAKLPPASTTT